MNAATQLLERGGTPTLEQVADAALVSRATAYRYFRSVDALIADAWMERRVQSPKQAFVGVANDPVARLFAVEATTNAVLLEDEEALHLVARNFIDQWIEQKRERGSMRPGRRLPLIDAALQTLEDVPPATRRRLRNALALTIGMEAVISMRDVCDLSVDEARATVRWAIEAMVAHARGQSSRSGRRK
jgi:AcrR family transcriptional regulator